MAKEDFENYYSNLLIRQYHSKPKAVGTAKALTSEFYADGLSDLISSLFTKESLDAQALVDSRVLIEFMARLIGVDLSQFEGQNNLFLTNILKLRMVTMLSDGSAYSITQSLQYFFGGEFFLDSFTESGLDLIYYYSSTLFGVELGNFDIDILNKNNILPRVMGSTIQILSYE